MNYLRFKKLFQSDNDGTFWPGYIELPDENDSSRYQDHLYKQYFRLEIELLQ